MLYAYRDGKKIAPIKGERAECFQGHEVLAKCGSKVSHHWAHVSGTERDCDDWSEMSEWHRSWQRHAPPERCEVRIEKEGKLHRADIVMLCGGEEGVLELQHSPISAEEIAARENFYGIGWWLYDATSDDTFRKNLVFSSQDSGFDYFPFDARWKRAHSSMFTHRWPVFWDLGEQIVRVHLVEHDTGRMVIVAESIPPTEFVAWIRDGRDATWSDLASAWPSAEAIISERESDRERRHRELQERIAARRAEHMRSAFNELKVTPMEHLCDARWRSENFELLSDAGIRHGTALHEIIDALGRREEYDTLKREAAKREREELERTTAQRKIDALQQLKALPISEISERRIRVLTLIADAGLELNTFVDDIGRRHELDDFERDRLRGLLLECLVAGVRLRARLRDRGTMLEVTWPSTGVDAEFKRRIERNESALVDYMLLGPSDASDPRWAMDLFADPERHRSWMAACIEQHGGIPSNEDGFKVYQGMKNAALATDGVSPTKVADLLTSCGCGLDPSDPLAVKLEDAPPTLAAALRSDPGLLWRATQVLLARQGMAKEPGWYEKIQAWPETVPFEDGRVRPTKPLLRRVAAELAEVGGPPGREGLWYAYVALKGLEEQVDTP